MLYHFAALVYGVVGFHKKPADIIADNNLTTINLMKYGHDRVKRVVYLSSSMVYETSRSFPHKEDETDTLPVMRTAYGLSKYIGERVVQSFQQQFGITYVIWRPFNIITPFEKPEEEGFSHVFSDMIEKILVRKFRRCRCLVMASRSVASRTSPMWLTRSPGTVSGPKWTTRP